MRFGAPVPILRIFSEDKAREFYLGYLGFQLDWEQRPGPDGPLRAQVSRAGLALQLSEHHVDASPGATVFIPTADLDAWHAELAGRPYRYQRPGLQNAEGGRELVLTDPFGNRLRFGERGTAGPQAAAAPAPAPGATPLTRAQVRAEYLRARAEGTLPPTGEA